MKWKPIKGFERYSVSDTGLVRRNDNGQHKASGDLLTQFATDGYAIVCLFRNGKRKYMKVHRLVAEAFIPGRKANQTQVAHLDGSRNNNTRANLVWATCGENLSHRRLHGTELLGVRNGRAKLDLKAVKDIRSRYKRRCPKNGAAALAKEYGVTDVAICKIASGQNWGRVI